MWEIVVKLNSYNKTFNLLNLPGVIMKIFISRYLLMLWNYIWGGAGSWGWVCKVIFLEIEVDLGVWQKKYYSLRPSVNIVCEFSNLRVAHETKEYPKLQGVRLKQLLYNLLLIFRRNSQHQLACLTLLSQELVCPHYILKYRAGSATGI